MTNSIEKLIDETKHVLIGSPYSLNAQNFNVDKLKSISNSMDETVELLGQTLTKKDREVSFERIFRSTEIFESNQIEGAGLPTLKATDEIIFKYSKQHSKTTDYVSWAIEKGILNDKHTYEVIGLDAARSLARDLALDISRPLSESDIRSIHKIIMGTDSSAGIYKRYANQIAGSSHEPPLPLDTPSHMRTFANWLTGQPTNPWQSRGSLVRAAVAHAWLAHIHPFEDGNGRLARLLANLILVREGMPPLILKNKRDRSEYLNALSLSDQGGDVTPLLFLFIKAINRVAQQMSDPERAQELFEMEIDIRKAGAFATWNSVIQEWFNEVRAQAMRYKLNFNQIGDITPSEFYQIKNKKPGYVWIGQFSSQSGNKILLYLGFPTRSLSNRLEKDQLFPTFYLGILNNNSPTGFYIPQNDSGTIYDTFMIEPREKKAFLQSYKKTVSGSLIKAAEELAKSAFTFSTSPPKPRFIENW